MDKPGFIWIIMCLMAGYFGGNSGITTIPMFSTKSMTDAVSEFVVTDEADVLTTEHSFKVETETEATTDVPCTPENSCEGHYTCDRATGRKICNEGYSGTDCKDRIRPAGPFDPACPSTAVCKNGGTCFDEGCCCVPGYAGFICEEEIIECDSSPCPYGRFCVDGVNGYSCICPEGYTGENCESSDITQVDDLTTEYSVRVETETGVTIKTDCRPKSSCDGHYNCDPVTGEKVCRKGYSGTECKDRTFQGVVDPQCPRAGQCKNGGTCFARSCCCAAGYEGILCEEEIIECNSNPCQNFGICRDDVNHYRCICIEGYVGENCEMYEKHTENTAADNENDGGFSYTALGIGIAVGVVLVGLIFLVVFLVYKCRRDSPVRAVHEAIEDPKDAHPLKDLHKAQGVDYDYITQNEMRPSKPKSKPSDAQDVSAKPEPEASYEMPESQPYVNIPQPSYYQELKQETRSPIKRN